MKLTHSSKEEPSSDLEQFGFDFSVIEKQFDSRILSYQATLDRLADPNVSLARFGDGEIKQLVRSFDIGFQPFSQSLQDELRSVVTSTNQNLLLGFPPVFRNAQWAKLWLDVLPEITKLFAHVECFANTAVSRPPCFNELKQEAVVGWRKVWDKQTVCIVTGFGSRFDLYEDLFGNAAGVDHVWSSPVDAYADIDRILGVITSARRYDRYLISLGSAGTVLAQKLAEGGYSALDIGHLSGSYNYVMNKGAYPEKMPIRRD